MLLRLAGRCPQGALRCGRWLRSTADRPPRPWPSQCELCILVCVPCPSLGDRGASSGTCRRSRCSCALPDPCCGCRRFSHCVVLRPVLGLVPFPLLGGEGGLLRAPRQVAVLGCAMALHVWRLGGRGASVQALACAALLVLAIWIRCRRSCGAAYPRRGLTIGQVSSGLLEGHSYPCWRVASRGLARRIRGLLRAPACRRASRMRCVRRHLGGTSSLCLRRVPLATSRGGAWKARGVPTCVPGLGGGL